MLAALRRKEKKKERDTGHKVKLGIISDIKLRIILWFNQSLPTTTEQQNS